MEEEWKIIDGFTNYLISNYGNIKQTNGEQRKITIAKNGSKSITLKKDDSGKWFTFQIAKLVAKSFVENSNNYNLVFHIDNNISNNYYKNLIWKTDKNRYVEMSDYYIGYDINENEFYFDIKDYELMSQYQWYIRQDGYTFSSKTKQHGSIYMHQLIMNSKIIDHKNRNRNDNRRENLRESTTKQNNYNQSISKGNTSGILGVAKRTQETKKKGVSEYWGAQIRYDGKHITKQFKIKEDAIKWRLEKELEYFGEFAPQHHLFEQYGIK